MPCPVARDEDAGIRARGGTCQTPTEEGEVGTFAYHVSPRNTSMQKGKHFVRITSRLNGIYTKIINNCSADLLVVKEGKCQLNVVVICNRQMFARAWSADSMHGCVCLLPCVRSDTDGQIRAKDVQSFWGRKQVVCTETAENTSNLGNSADKIMYSLGKYRRSSQNPKKKKMKKKWTEQRATWRRAELQKNAGLRVCRCALKLFLFGAALHTRRDGMTPRPRIKRRSPCPAPVMAIPPSIPGRPIDSISTRRHGHGPWALDFTVRSQSICFLGSRHCHGAVRPRRRAPPVVAAGVLVRGKSFQGGRTNERGRSGARDGFAGHDSHRRSASFLPPSPPSALRAVATPPGLTGVPVGGVTEMDRRPKPQCPTRYISIHTFSASSLPDDELLALARAAASPRPSASKAGAPFAAASSTSSAPWPWPRPTAAATAVRHLALAAGSMSRTRFLCRSSPRRRRSRRRQWRAKASGALTKASPSRLTTAHGQHPSAMTSASVTATQDRHVCAVQSAWSTTGTAAGPHPSPPCPSWW
ncbi:hypothetical protein C2845_PM07G17610 [Panicum miliaceum]|uniref:Uncharacterized protein n=1 Tax=Panicum miliaceum TaxID=4540 RepID=A0A3L6SI14_PANMI|nr:hypothetical protein C2845_PM07G17610 [Panicum miliaceum]